MRNVFKPILFSASMVQAILEDRKTQTRRIVKDNLLQNPDPDADFEFIFLTVSKKINEGDILWVRENLYQNGELGLEYSSNGETIDEEIIPIEYGPYGGQYSFRTIPCIHMPKWACRIFIKVKSVRIERLNDISENDAIAEGCSKYGPFGEYRGSAHPNGGKMKYRAYSKAVTAFQCIWEGINGSESWYKNPWVWVIEFERIEKPLNFI
jgi:hypothetical protein